MSRSYAAMVRVVTNVPKRLLPDNVAALLIAHRLRVEAESYAGAHAKLLELAKASIPENHPPDLDIEIESIFLLDHPEQADEQYALDGRRILRIAPAGFEPENSLRYEYLWQLRQALEEASISPLDDVRVQLGGCGGNWFRIERQVRIIAADPPPADNVIDVAQTRTCFRVLVPPRCPTCNSDLKTRGAISSLFDLEDEQGYLAATQRGLRGELVVEDLVSKGYHRRSECTRCQKTLPIVDQVWANGKLLIAVYLDEDGGELPIPADLEWTKG